MNPGVDTNTPHLAVIDGRGLPVRQVAYCRREVSELTPQVRVTAQQHDAAGRRVTQRDPRLLAPTARPNLTTVYSVSGAVLLTDSVDAGWRLALTGEAGQTPERWDERGTHWKSQYDEQLRPTEIHEEAQGTGGRTVERLSYADNAPEFAGRNQCGQLIRHDDPAGTQLFAAFGLTGGMLEQTRHFLRESDSPDWPKLSMDRDKLLESGVGATTRSRFNPLGEALEQTDAKGNRQLFSQTVAGQLREVWLQLQTDASPKTLVSAIQYNAFGQTERETAGNGMLTTLEYAAEDGRLSRLHTEALQDLRYEYDPVGNVLSIEDAALPIRYFANQRIEPINRYRYDSLYQLIEANGWEAGAANQGPSSSADAAAVGSYRQTYRYDAGNNLLELTHVGPQSPGHRLVAAQHSNRCLPVRNGVEPGEEDFRNGFDANGNLLNLQPGQALSWDLRNQLREVRPVERDSAADDSERYVYGADGMRVRKVSSTQTHAQPVIAEVRYLPGLELRTHSGTGEVLQVINVQAGRSSVRVLHWQAKRPAEIANDQQRYSLSDHLGSATLELDQDAKVISQERYYPFGGTAWADGEAVQVSYKIVRYSGKERDATGLYYYGFRYYIPWLQRWVNPDPAGPVDGLNVYAFVKSSPVSMTDKKGLFGWPWNRARASSPLVADLIEIYKRPNEGVYRTFLGNEKEVMGGRLESLAEQTQDLPGLMEYAEGGNGVSDEINFFLRGLPTSEEEIQTTVENLKREVEMLPDYQGEAYRAFRVNAGVFGNKIKVGSIVADQGYMSASVVPQHTISWLETWADHKPDTVAGQQRVLLVFDEQAPKKVAATAFLADHLLIKPLTQFKVKEIHHLTSEVSSNDVTVVGVQYMGDTSRHKIRDLRSGDVLLSAINPGFLSRVQSRFSKV